MKRDHKASVQDWRITNHAHRPVTVREDNPVCPWAKRLGYLLGISILAHQAYTYFQGVVG